MRGVPEVRWHPDHASVYPVPLVRPAAAPPAPVTTRRPRCQAAREALHPELAVAGHPVRYRVSFHLDQQRDGRATAARFAPTGSQPNLKSVAWMTTGDDPRLPPRSLSFENAKGTRARDVVDGTRRNSSSTDGDGVGRLDSRSKMTMVTRGGLSG